MQNQDIRPSITPIDPKGVPRAPVPYYIEIEPAAQVAAGANVVVRYTVGPRDFVCKGWGFTSERVGVPLQGMYFKIGIVDLGASIRFQPFRFHATCVTGTNPGLADQPKTDFPDEAPWNFSQLTTIEVEFENIGALPCTPTLVLCGYLN